jgi:hypothetical protein
MADDKCWFCQSSARMTRSPLPECQFADGKSRGVGREEPRRSEGITGQSQVGAASCEVPGAIGCGADGTDEDGAYAAKMDDWIAWEAVEGAAPRDEG